MTIKGTGRRRAGLGLSLLAAVLLSGCAGTMRSYDAEAGATVASAKRGQAAAALKKLEEDNKNSKDLLYYFEKGELLRLTGNFTDSRDTWLQADELVRAWEDEAKTNPDKVLGEIGAFLVNDKVRRYDGQDFEKVMLAARLALDHLALGDWNSARVEINKMHGRERVIEELRAKEVEDLKKKAEENKVKTTYKELKGYPVELLDDPEVVALRNGYQSAFGHYLAGFVYEALNEPGLAAAGYRQAIELQPGQPLLQSALEGLDQRAGKRVKGETDVLLVVEAGDAPAIKSVNVPLPVFAGKKGLILVPTSFPTINRVPGTYLPGQLALGNKEIPIVPVTNVDAMARRALKDRLPGIIVRSTIRAIAKSVVQAEVQKRDSSGVLSLLTAVAAVATESADERAWRALPAVIGIGRMRVPAGKYTVSLPNSPFKQEVDIDGGYAVVSLRTAEGYLTLAQTPPDKAPPAEVVADAQALLAKGGEEQAKPKDTGAKKTTAKASSKVTAAKRVIPVTEGK